MKHLQPVALTCLAAGALGVSCSAPKESKPLNIVYILADDLGYGDPGCYGQAVIRTPNIDRLAAAGVRFTQHYSGCTVSAPSRSALMTGLHTGHTYIRGNRAADKELSPEGQEPLPADTYTLAKMFQQAGYATGAFGKWGLGYPGSTGDPLMQGFDRFYGYNCQSLAHKYYPDHLWDDTIRVELPNTEAVQIAYAPDLIHEQALAFIEANRDRPFFLFMPYVLPHAELLAPEDEILASYEQAGFDEVPYDGGTLGDYGPGMNWRAYASQDEPNAHFAAMITRLDAYVGEVVDKLAELGLTENTLVVFTSDNGPHQEGGANPAYFQSWGPLRGTQRDMYEGGIRVPMIASLPGTIEAGTESDHVSAFWDVMPTFAELIGAELPAAGDGLSFAPALTGGEQPQHEYLYWEFHEGGGKIAVRMGDWKAIRLDVSRNPDGPIELYDLSTDLHEDRNVAAEHPDVVARMAGIMRSAHTESELFPF